MEMYENTFGSDSHCRGNPYLHLLAEEGINVIDGLRRKILNESSNKHSLSTKPQRPSRRADEQVEVRATSYL